jgi:RNA 3'-terminal phosphate cyclase (ATP)
MSTMSDWVEVDGSAGEGGGQVVRGALALSLGTGRACRIDGIRARRDKPGLRPQHVAAVRLAAAVGGASVQGDDVGSRSLVFVPQNVRPGRYTCDVGTAGSTALVLQAVLPALAGAGGPSELVLRGGTHTRRAPSVDFVARTLAPRFGTLGTTVHVDLIRPGFEPVGDGEIHVEVRPRGRLGRYEALGAGRSRVAAANALVAGLDESIGHREVQLIGEVLSLPQNQLHVVTRSDGPGNAVSIDVETEAGVEVFTALGRIGLRAERVARNAIRDARTFLRAGVPVGPHLADQLLVPMALGAGGAFDTVRPTSHATTQARLVGLFLPEVSVRFSDLGGGRWRCEVTHSDTPHAARP